MRGKNFANPHNRFGRGLSIFPCPRDFFASCALLLEAFLVGLAACALAVAVLHYALGLWLFVFGALFVCGAFGFAAALLEDFRRNR